MAGVAPHIGGIAALGGVPTAGPGGRPHVAQGAGGGVGFLGHFWQGGFLVQGDGGGATGFAVDVLAGSRLLLADHDYRYYILIQCNFAGGSGGGNCQISHRPPDVFEVPGPGNGAQFAVDSHDRAEFSGVFHTSPLFNPADPQWFKGNVGSNLHDGTGYAWIVWWIDPA